MRRDRAADDARQEAENARMQASESAELLEATRRDLEARDNAHQVELQHLGHLIAKGQRDVMERDAELGRLHAQLRAVEGSVTWSLFQKARTRLYRILGGRSSLPGRLMQAALRGVGRVTGVTGTSPPPPTIRFPTYDNPVASLLISVHSHADLTAACLDSILANTASPSYEVIIIDDTSDAATKRLLTRVQNATVLVNDRNLGNVLSMNRGCSVARGRYVVLFNNDTEVQPGWLAALVDRAESAPDIGAVAPKFLYPDGALQEAGAIVFRDGSAWNFGRGDDPGRPQYNYAREIDYASSACLLVRSDLMRHIGGLDERYVPLYYDDVDLCFAVRANGSRVVFEPLARVIHVEGAASGTDERAGSKQYQVVNRTKFVQKWSSELEARQVPFSPARVRRASDRNQGRHVLVIDHRIPTPDRDAGSLRMRYVIEALQELNCRVTFLPDDGTKWEPYTRQLQGIGVEVLDGRINISEELCSIGSALQLAIASRPYVAARYLHHLRAHTPHAHIAYDTVDLHFVRETGRAVFEPGYNAGLVAASFRELEFGLIRACDTTIVVTQEERDQVLSEVPDARVEIVPLANQLAQNVPGPDGRANIVFVGGFEHLPNVDAVKYLVNSIMPHVRRALGDVTLTIAGASPPPEVLALASSQVEVTGWIDDLRPLLDRSRVMAAPLRYGAGMKGKVTQSLALGLPVVTTPTGAEGLHPNDDELLIASEPEAFADQLVKVYRDDALWRQLSTSGQRLAERTCSPRILKEGVERLLGRCQGSTIAAPRP